MLTDSEKTYDTIPLEMVHRCVRRECVLERSEKVAGSKNNGYDHVWRDGGVCGDGRAAPGGRRSGRSSSLLLWGF